MSKVRSWGFKLAFVCCGSMITATPTIAGTNDRVNLSGKLRMLSQRVAAAGCNLNAGISADQSLETITASSVEFTKIMNGLRDGDADLDLNSETSGEVLAKLDALQGSWAPINSAITTLVKDTASVAAMDVLNTHNMALLEDAKSLVVSVVKENVGAEVAGSNIGKLIDIAGRQRMLTQKMSKEACQIWSGDASVEKSEALQATLTLFETSLKALYTGDEEHRIARPPSRAIKDALAEVNKDWRRDVRPVLEFALHGGQATDEERAKLINDLHSLFVKSNNVVGLYVSYETDQQVVRDEGATERVNFSGKLRMLSQRTAALSCNLAAHISHDTTHAQLISADAEFNAILTALEYGSPELKIRGAERRRKTLRAIANTHKEWDNIDHAIAGLLKGEAPQENLQFVVEHNIPLLDATKILASEVNGQYSDPVAMLQADAFLIDISGRQRMLTQKMSKEACLVWSGIDTAASGEALAGTMQLFEATLVALREGMDPMGIKPAPTPTIKSGLELVADEWNALKPRLQKAVAGEQVDDKTRADVLAELNMMLIDMNAVVGKYAIYAKTGT